MPLLRLTRRELFSDIKFISIWLPYWKLCLFEVRPIILGHVSIELPHGIHVALACQRNLSLSSLGSYVTLRRQLFHRVPPSLPPSCFVAIFFVNQLASNSVWQWCANFATLLDPQIPKSVPSCRQLGPMPIWASTRGTLLLTSDPRLSNPF